MLRRSLSFNPTQYTHSTHAQIADRSAPVGVGGRRRVTQLTRAPRCPCVSGPAVASPPAQWPHDQPGGDSPRGASMGASRCRPAAGWAHTPTLDPQRVRSARPRASCQTTASRLRHAAHHAYLASHPVLASPTLCSARSSYLCCRPVRAFSISPGIRIRNVNSRRGTTHRRGPRRVPRTCCCGRICTTTPSGSSL